MVLEQKLESGISYFLVYVTAVKGLDVFNGSKICITHKYFYFLCNQTYTAP